MLADKKNDFKQIKIMEVMKMTNCKCDECGNKKYYVGQELKNSPFDSEPAFILVKMTESIITGDKYYYCKDIDGDRIQKTTEDFLYPHN